MIHRLRLNNFTAFEELDVEFSPGINIFVGANATGKTHLLKILYASCDITKTQKNFAEKIVSVFMPSSGQIGRLVNREKGSKRSTIQIARSGNGISENTSLNLAFSNHTKKPGSADIEGASNWSVSPVESVYIPVKEMLSNAPGFRSLYNSREVSFEEVYADIVDRALLPIKRGPVDKKRKSLLTHLKNIMDGTVESDKEEFFLKSRQGRLEFSLLAEGVRKLGLLWVLIQNGTLVDGSVLCWDEPEANLNPRLLKSIVEILLILQRSGVQVFLATHNYVLLKEFDLQITKEDKVMFHALGRAEGASEVKIYSTKNYLEIQPNVIADTYADIYDREVQRTLGE